MIGKRIYWSFIGASIMFGVFRAINVPFLFAIGGAVWIGIDILRTKLKPE